MHRGPKLGRLPCKVPTVYRLIHGSQKNNFRPCCSSGVFLEFSPHRAQRSVLQQLHLPLGLVTIHLCAQGAAGDPGSPQFLKDSHAQDTWHKAGRLVSVPTPRVHRSLIPQGKEVLCTISNMRVHRKVLIILGALCAILYRSLQFINQMGTLLSILLFTTFVPTSISQRKDERSPMSPSSLLMMGF